MTPTPDITSQEALSPVGEGSAVGHTPGPWHVGADDASEVFGADGYSVAEIGGVHIVEHPDGKLHQSEPGQSVERSWEEECANARLIAAAPDGYELARKIVEASELSGARGPLRDLADAIIAKAEGL